MEEESKEVVGDTVSVLVPVMSKSKDVVSVGAAESPKPKDRDDLLTLCPKEIWTILLEQYLRHRSKDLLSCSRTCTLFDDILKESKSNWMFELVFPRIFPYLSGSEVLKCRQVSKAWCHAVDLFLENFETRVPFTEGLSDLSITQRYNPLGSKKISGVKLDMKSKIKRFMEELTSEKNHFVGRAVWVTDEEMARNPSSNRNRNQEQDANCNMDFWEMSLDMLALHGEYISHFTTGNAFGLGAGLGTKRFHEVLRRSLVLMPQLKSLHLYGICNFYDDHDHNNGHAAEFPDEKTRKRIFKEFLDRSPFPEVKGLEMLELTYTFGFPPSLMEKLIMINPVGLKRLEIDVSELDINDDPDTGQPAFLRLPSSGILTQLRDLNIKVCSSEQLRQFLEFVSRDSKLLRLFVNYDCDNEHIDYHKLCEAVNPFASSLQMLGIMSHDPEDYENGIGIRIDFNEPSGDPDHYKCSLSTLVAPVLKSLEMDGVEFQPDYLSPETAASVEYLHVRRFFRRDVPSQSQSNNGLHENQKRARKEKDFYAYVFDDELQKSDIWEKMKKLKVIKAESCSRESHVNRYCTREMYEFYGTQG